MFNKTKNQNKGITLIALVITIIVLLILAGISIAMLSGNNSILKQAGRAREETERTAEEEQRRIAAMTAITNIEKTTYNGVTIPAGFAPTKIVGETTVEEGLVITDSKRNEFVWVEVPKTADVYSDLNIENFTDENCLKIAKDLAIYSGSSLSNNPTSLSDHLPSVGEGIPDYTTAYKNMLKSVYLNGGFWIGRYETGIQGTENAIGSARDYGTDYTSEHSTTGHVAVIKANVQPYTWVRWGQAQSLAQGISSGNSTSSLLMGVQWDLVLKFLEKNGDTDSHDWGNYCDSVFSLKPGSHYVKSEGGLLSDTWKSYNEDEIGFVESGEKKSKSSGNGILCTTGANTTNNSKKNICDIAGNVYEWTIENTSDISNPCAVRGGRFSRTGSNFSASYRYIFYTSSSDYSIGFRVSLW